MTGVTAMMIWSLLLDGDPESRIEWRDLALTGFWGLIQPRTPTVSNPGTYEYMIFRTQAGTLAAKGTARNQDHAKRQVHGWEQHCLAHPDAAPRP